MVLVDDQPCIYVSVRYIPFQSIPLAVLVDLILIDDHLHILAYLKEFVISTLVDLVLRQCVAAICLAQAVNSTLAVVCLTVCTGL